jgi:aminoglycoside phosphotransferase (APT) family kinase protein
MSIPGTLSAGLQLREVFERWLEVHEQGAAVAAAAQSAEHTLLVDAGWGGQPHRLVVRLASGGPTETRCQYLTLRRLGAQLMRPAVPAVLWCEDDPAPLGTPFFVMTHLDGLTTSKYQTPYTFGSWITDATADERERMQRATLEQLARVHAATPADFAFLDRRRPGESALAAHLRQIAEHYETQSSRGLRAPVIERAFGWVREHWPSESAPVLCWGDARIDNGIYRDFGTVSLVRWQRATLGPREMDLGALVFHHRVADDLARSAGRPGLPDFLQSADVAAAYADITGYHPGNLDFFIAYAALSHAVDTMRTPLRARAFEVLSEILTGET